MNLQALETVQNGLPSRLPLLSEADPSDCFRSPHRAGMMRSRHALSSPFVDCQRSFIWEVIGLPIPIIGHG